MNWRTQKPYDFDLVHTLWLLGKFPSEQMPDVAAEAMVAGHDGPALLELASFHRPTRGELEGKVAPAFSEINGRAMTRDEAALQLAWVISSQIVGGHVNPADGLREIGTFASWGDGPPALEGFLRILEEEDLYPPTRVRQQTLDEALRFLDGFGKGKPHGPGARRYP